MFRKIDKVITKASLAVFAFLLTTLPAMANVDPTKTTEWESLWNTFVDLLKGYPGMIAAATLIIAGLFSLWQGRLGGAVISIVVAAAIFIVPNIVQGFAFCF